VGKRFAISYRGGRVVKMWKEEHDFPKVYINLPQMEMWKIIFILEYISEISSTEMWKYKLIINLLISWERFNYKYKGGGLVGV
jgi:hypothetical protein